MRADATTSRGGDTVVLEKLYSELKQLGTDVAVDLEGTKNPADFDIAHIINFATPDATLKHSTRCVERNTPYVVTTLYEDWTQFFNKKIMGEIVFGAYVVNGQSRELLSHLETLVSNVPLPAILDNHFSAKHACMLIASGEEERQVVERDYAVHGKVEICHFGNDFITPADGGKSFREYLGITDYILCVGRLEKRKNQLALLKALEDWDLPLVFATGGVSQEKEYSEYCQLFKRRGKNYFVERIPESLLASAYEGATCHVLPSWYELPGLVTIEAAARGTPVVAADAGTIKDYLGDLADYCQPDSYGSIENAVVASLKRTRSNDLRNHVSQFTWANSAKRMLELYEMALDSSYNVLDRSNTSSRFNTKLSLNSYNNSSSI